MESIRDLLDGVSRRLEELAKSSAVVGKPLSVGERHVVPLCELGLAFGGGGGWGESTERNAGAGTGSGAVAVGVAKAIPVALLVVEGDKVRLESFGQ
jgi:uncharacterized spore protein YtfJ